MKLALVETSPELLPIQPLSDAEVGRFREYLRKNLSSDLVLQILEECLLEENSTYNSLDFERALKDLQQKDSGRYYLLKALLEGFATKEGLVMLDPKLVTASYKQRVKQLETLKSMSRSRRFLFRLGQAIQGLLTERGETEAIQEAIQLTGEVHIAKEELAAAELRKAQAVKEANDLMAQTSEQCRRKLEAADERATQKSEAAYAQSRKAIADERKQALTQLGNLHKQIEAVHTEIARLSLQRNKLKSEIPEGFYQTGAGKVSYQYGDLSYSRSQSLSPSVSPSASLSPSASQSPSASPSPSAEPDEGLEF